MTMDKETEKQAPIPDNAYVSIAHWGDCKVCGRHEDLRCGACFKCSDNVCGEKVEGGHRLWQADKPENTWYVRADQ